MNLEKVNFDYDAIDKRMVEYEANQSPCLPENGYIVARLDGNGFSKMTKRIAFQKPFDDKFHQLMIDATKECMNSGFRIIYGYTTSDEITLLLHPHDNSYSRRTAKFDSLLASAASGRFSIDLGTPVKFDCRTRVYEKEDAVKCFLWRQMSGFRNAINGYVYWTLIDKEGMSGRSATRRQDKMPIKESIALLNDYGITLDSIPAWQLYGSTLYKVEKTVKGLNPQTKEMEDAIRHVLINDDSPLHNKELFLDIYNRLDAADNEV